MSRTLHVVREHQLEQVRRLTPMPPASSRVRPAVVADVPVILQLVRELAEYEKALHEVDATLEQLEQALFPDGHEPAAFAHVA